MKSPRDLVIRAAHDRRLPAGKRWAFTLVELLVVILIILLVSAVALPTVLPAIAHRQVSEAARVVQGALAGARDAAIHNNSLSGVRLLPDPAFPLQYTTTTVNGISIIQISPTNILAANRFIPIQPGPNYSEGLINITSPSFDQTNGTGPVVPYPLGGGNYPYPPVPGLGGGNVLMIEESVYDPHSATAVPNPPTSWFWNIRVGDKIQVNTSGDLYTVVGPMVVAPWNGNPEMFVNLRLPGAAIPSTYYPTRSWTPPGSTQAITYQPEFLFVVNGQDDNGNGLVDEGWNGIDDNLDRIRDNLVEWEPETWLGSIGNTLSTITWTAGVPVFGRIQNQSYTIIRRPVPSPNARETALPSNVVIDLTSVLLANPERSRFPVGTIDPYTGHVDIVLTPRGDVVPTTIYSSPASVGLTGAFYHFWLAERGDLFAIQTDSNGNPTPLVQNYPFYLPMPLGSNYTPPTNAYDLLVRRTRSFHG